MNYYQPNYQSYNPYQQQQNGIIWVQGETAAKSYMVPSGASVLLMDSDQSRFYIKTTDTSGMPQRLRTFQYKQITQVQQQPSVKGNYISREQFDSLKEMVMKLKGEKSDGKPTVQRAKQ